ncbi:MAG: hypothetical protein JNN05_04830 [Candidatus Omnitrophica bacterium]|nr:hypothetical protein [Candidatus Omnitrophota bacterium]
MALVGLTATPLSVVNFQLIRYASEHLPAILVDCANAACPHRYYPMINLSAMQQIYVFELELLHKFRDVLKRVPLYIRNLKVKSIIVTTSDRLINYHDEKENNDIYTHCWVLMKKIGQTNDIVVGVAPHSHQYNYAVRFCDRLETVYGTHRSFSTRDD